MNEPKQKPGTPRSILLATDLSARSDRALDRAVLLARQWQAQLLIVHVLQEPEDGNTGSAEVAPSWRRGPDRTTVAQANIETELQGTAPDAKIIVVEGDPAEAILEVAAREQCGLIVAGVARNEMFGQFGLGQTVAGLVRSAQVPVLVVKRRARHGYGHMVVATDFSQSSRHAMAVASALFPEPTLTIFHAYGSAMTSRMADSDALREFRKLAEHSCNKFLKDFEEAQKAEILIEHGMPSSLLRDYVSNVATDLVVVGTHGRGAILEMMLGSVAKRVLDDVACDVLVVREPRGA